LTTALAELAEVHPSAFVTVKEYVPASRPVKVRLVPLPFCVVPPLIVSVHVPLEGRPPSDILPVAVWHVGWVILLITGAEGTWGAGSITASADLSEVQVSNFTVKLYVPAFNPVIVMLVPEPMAWTPPGNLVRVQVPDDGNPVISTLPV
jgi:hypothetical protein